MNLPDSALSWAALRSGQALNDFIASLTPEKEVEIMDAYNRWRREHGLTEMETLLPRKEHRKHKPYEEYVSHAVSNVEHWKVSTGKRRE